MRRQLRAEGTHGVTCQTAGEAVSLAAAGFTDILVSNVVADRSSLDQLGRAAQAARVTITADCLAHVRLLEQAAAAADATFGVLAEVDVGAGPVRPACPQPGPGARSPRPSPPPAG